MDWTNRSIEIAEGTHFPLLVGLACCAGPIEVQDKRSKERSRSNNLGRPERLFTIRPEIAAFDPKTVPNLTGGLWMCYNACGCNLRLSEVRSESFGLDLGPAWGPKGPTHTGPKSARPALGQPQIAAT